MRKFLIPAILLLMLFSANIYGKTLPLVYVVATGGTIAGKAASQTSAVYTPGVASVHELILSAPGIDKLARLKEVQFSNINSCDVTIQDWLNLSRLVNTLLQRKEVAGVVITHGTDTMEETAYFLDLTVKSKKPVVIVGSMRSASSLSPDGPLNLYNAVAVAASKSARNRNVMVVMNDKIFDGRNVTKTDTTNVDTFEAPNTGPTGLVHYAKVNFYTKTKNVEAKVSPFKLTGIQSLPKVVIIYEYGGKDASMFKAAIHNKVAGIIFAGTGDGSIAKPERKLLQPAIKKGIILVRSSRTGSGVVDYTTLYGLDNKIGTIPANDLNPQKARILLMLALTKTHNPNKIRQFFARY